MHAVAQYSERANHPGIHLSLYGMQEDQAAMVGVKASLSAC